MSKVMIRYFFDFLDGQQNWLNQMAAKGYRLMKCGQITYTFEECEPNQYEYAVEYVGDRSYSDARLYQRHLSQMELRTFTKNINLNLSYGKIRWRPYAKGMGQLATAPGGFNKELLILEKKRDGKPFKLHTTMQDKLDAYRAVQRTYLWSLFVMSALAAVSFIPNESTRSDAALWIARGMIGIFAILLVIPTIKYTSLVKKLKEESSTFE